MAPLLLRALHGQVRDLQAWLFRFGAGIRIEKSQGLRELLQPIAEEEVAVYGETP